VVKRLLDIFSLRIHRNRYLGTFDQKSDPTIRSGDIEFLRFGHIFDVCAQFLFHLVTLTFDLLTLAVSEE